jgi:hypothetical protein
MVFKEIVAVYSENHKKLINTLCGQNTEFAFEAGDSHFYRYALKGNSLVSA